MMIAKGSKVTVLTRYMGNGAFAPDGNEGAWYVVRQLPNKYGCADLLLTRDPAADAWEVCVTLQRVDGMPEASWRQGK